jgi:Tfp pilus assembly protein PilX
VAESERGIALLAVLGFLIMMGFIAAGLILSVNADRRSTVRTLGGDMALNVAEAGVTEAMERIRSGDVPGTPDPEMVSQIYLCKPDEVPTVGQDTTALATWQNPSGWLTYSTPGRSDDALTVRFKTDASRHGVYRYDDTQNPAIQMSSGAPIFVVTSTGRESDARRTIVTEVARAHVHVDGLNVWGAVVSGGSVQLQNDTYQCGFNHRMDTPAWTGINGRTGEAKSCDEDLANEKWEVGPPMDDRYAIWAAGRIEGASGGHYGGPRATAQEQGGFYAGCWQALNMQESDFQAMVGSAVQGPLKRKFRGITHTAGPTIADQSDGEGLLYVEGDLTIRDDFTYRGLVYATGQIVVDGSCWVLGSMMAEKGVVIASRSGTSAFLYSREAIEDGVGRYGTRFVRLSWREE